MRASCSSNPPYQPCDELCTPSQEKRDTVRKEISQAEECSQAGEEWGYAPPIRAAVVTVACLANPHHSIPNTKRSRQVNDIYLFVSNNTIIIIRFLLIITTSVIILIAFSIIIIIVIIIIKSIVTIASPLEYFSKLHMMQQALQFSAMTAMQPHMPGTIPLLPMIRKGGFNMYKFNTIYVLFPCRSLPSLRPARVDSSTKGNAKKYRCDICEKTFSRSNTLITHKVKPYVCAHCDKAFNRASNLHTHMRTHSGK
uniref:C2H2-type domain-containing protein n=1 Tax=Heterorhabditis bacteriophora TaxID=37862 RepID=A0A1I7WSQ1_HETBA